LKREEQEQVCNNTLSLGNRLRIGYNSRFLTLSTHYRRFWLQIGKKVGKGVGAAAGNSRSTKKKG